MKKHLYLPVLIIIAVVLVRCGGKEKTVLKKVTYEKITGDCQNDICVDIELKYFTMEGDSTIASKFNKAMEDMIFGKLAYDNSHHLSKEELVDNIIKEFNDYKKEFPDGRSGGFQYKTNSRITYKSDNLISIFITSYIYSGGAHGSHLEEFFNFNPKTGEKTDIMNFITDKEKFNALIEKKLRKKLKMSDTDKWEDFTFVDKFTLPGNMGMTGNGLKLIYNEYEILPYAEGITTITVSKKEMKDFVDLEKLSLSD